MVGQMVGIALVGSWQILAGPGRTETLWHLPTGSYLVLALTMLLGVLSCLTATITADSWTGAAYELFGEMLLMGPLVIYFVSVLSTARYPDTDIVTALLGGLIVGLAWRIVNISIDAVGVVRSHRAPPVGDLDLLTADRVDSVATLVADQHGTARMKQDVELLSQIARHRQADDEQG